MKEEYAIFISYRREGGAQYARILKAELEKRGYRDRVFLDYDALKDGRFDQRIMQAIDCAPIFIFVLSPGALDRCINEDDWVRQEIMYALKKERHIIPVNFDNLFNGFSTNIPNQIKNALGQHQFTKIDSESLLDASLEKLIRERIAPIAPPAIASNTIEAAAEIVVIPDVDCKIVRFGKPVAYAPADKETILRLIKGNHLLDFVSTEFPEIRQRVKYVVPDNDYCDFIEISLKEKVRETRLNNKILIPTKSAQGLWGYKDKEGSIVIPCIYDLVWFFKDGLARIRNESGKYGFIDKNGIQKIPPIYGNASNYSVGRAWVQNSDGKWGTIDRNGNQAIPFCYKDILRVYTYDLTWVKNDSGLWMAINSNGDIVSTEQYTYIDSYKEDLATVRNKAGKYGFVDLLGRLVIPCLYDTAEDFKNGVARVSLWEQRWGYIDKNGNEVIPCEYLAIGKFSEGLCWAMNQVGKYGYMDIEGKSILPFIYKYAGDFEKGQATVLLDSGYIKIDNKGTKIINVPLKSGKSSMTY